MIVLNTSCWPSYSISNVFLNLDDIIFIKLFHSVPYEDKISIKQQYEFAGLLKMDYWT